MSSSIPYADTQMCLFGGNSARLGRWLLAHASLLILTLRIPEVVPDLWKELLMPSTCSNNLLRCSTNCVSRSSKKSFAGPRGLRSGTIKKSLVFNTIWTGLLGICGGPLGATRIVLHPPADGRLILAQE